ncbi:MAG TPA: VOC family protein [Candidatus Sulfomarinibacteraceae bacterium]|nr:VOC family protein [Candidatus Sulfomarinibacteraceae bacterium]
MTGRGYSHINLVTQDVDKTCEFYEGVLGFSVVAAGIYRVSEGGHFRHIYLDVGQGQLLSFLEPRDIPGFPEDIETDINSALGVPPVCNHLAFEAGSPEKLQAIREELQAKGIPVTEVVDHDWCHSIYFDDPVNGLKLEYACYTRSLTVEDAELTERFELPLAAVHALTRPTD